jgi:MFS family permease
VAQEPESTQVHAPPETSTGPPTAWFSPERPSYKWWVTLALMLSMLAQGLNFGTVNVALPSMMTALQAEIDTIHWVITAFMITRTVIMPAVGWLAAVLGQRTFYLLGLLVYILGSVLCGLAWSIPSLVVFRAIQALGAGPLFPLSMAMLYEVFPAHQRGLAMGIFMAGISVGPALGPSIGGYLVEHLNWRMIFYLNLPMGVIALGAVAVVLPKTTRPQYVSMAALFIERQQAVHALGFSEDQSFSPIGTMEAEAAVQGNLQAEGEWDLLSTKALLVLREEMLDAAAVLAYRDCYLAIAFSSLLSLAVALFLRLPRRR